MVTVTGPGGSLSTNFTVPPFSSTSRHELLADRVFLHARHAHFLAVAAGVVGEPLQGLELGQVAGFRKIAERVDRDARILGRLQHLVVVVAGVVGLAIAQNDQGLTVGGLPRQLADRLECRLVELRGQGRRSDRPHLFVEVGLGGGEIRRQVQIVGKRVGREAPVALARIRHLGDGIGHQHDVAAAIGIGDLHEEQGRQRPLGAGRSRRSWSRAHRRCP